MAEKEKKQTFEEWYKEDAERVNQMSDQAVKSKMVVQTGEGNLPKLNADGTLVGK